MCAEMLIKMQIKAFVTPKYFADMSWNRSASKHATPQRCNKNFYGNDEFTCRILINLRSTEISLLKTRQCPSYANPLVYDLNRSSQFDPRINLGSNLRG